MKTPIAYYGGKQTLISEIVPLLYEHKSYVEPFCGGAAIFFAKAPSEMETINDTNGELINFYRIVQQDFTSLEKEIKITLHSRRAHGDASAIYERPWMHSPLKRAWAIWVLSCQAFCSMFDGSWGYDRSGTTARKIANKREGFTYELSRRLQQVQIECTDALKIIRTYDTPDTLFYCDPPYYNSDCGHYDGYTIEDYERLLIALSKIEGKFLLSSYPSALLDKYVIKHRWHQKKFNLKVSVATHGQQKDKTEVITANYELKKNVDLVDIMKFG